MKERMTHEAPRFLQSGEMDGMKYCLAGEAVHGDTGYIEDGIIAVGEDTLLFRPDLHLFGVFDGAGGAKDIGRPDLASQKAAQSVAESLAAAGNLEVNLAEVMNEARKAVTDHPSAGLTTALFVQVLSDKEHITIRFAAAGDCTAGIYPDPDYDDRKYDDVLWFAGDQSDPFGSPTNYLGTEQDRVSRMSEDQIGEVVIKRSKKQRWLFLSTDGVTGSFGIYDGIDESDIEYAFTYNHDVITVADALINPPLQREIRRKVDDKSLIVIALT
jgi:serine/threonine protein phosphatase PrpC